MSQNASLQNLLQSAQDDGVLSPTSANLLNLQDIGAQIQGGMGNNVGQMQLPSTVILVTLLIDDSGSISCIKDGPDAMVKGVNGCIRALKESKQKDAILFHARALSGQVYTPYCELDNVPPFGLGVYDPSYGSTPLYAQAKVVLGTVFLKAQELAEEAQSCRTVTLFATDGADNASRGVSAQDVKTIAEDLLRMERNIIVGMGIEDRHTNFTRVFTGMGIPAQWILTPGNSASDIRKAFAVFSQSAIAVSQAANLGPVSQAGFGSQTVLGGFTT